MLSDAVRRHPGRFAGFASVAAVSPDAAAEELARTVHEYGLLGAVINGHIAGISRWWLRPLPAVSGSDRTLGRDPALHDPTPGQDVAPTLTGLHHPVSHYLRTNVDYTFAGFDCLPTFELLLTQVGIERIMFSADHPFPSMAEARDFLDALPVDPATGNSPPGR